MLPFHRTAVSKGPEVELEKEETDQLRNSLRRHLGPPGQSKRDRS